MPTALKRICLDTNVYIIGTQVPDSNEAKILRAIGYYGKEHIQPLTMVAENLNVLTKNIR